MGHEEGKKNADGSRPGPADASRATEDPNRRQDGPRNGSRGGGRVSDRLCINQRVVEANFKMDLGGAKVEMSCDDKRGDAALYLKAAFAASASTLAAYTLF